MDISANIAATTARLAVFGGSLSRWFVIAAAAGGIAIAGTATLRLAAITAATPSSIWLKDHPPLIDPSVAVEPQVQRLARRLSSIISDTTLIRATQSACAVAQAPKVVPRIGERSDGLSDCLEQIGRGLAVSPASGELWLFKANVLASAGNFDSTTFDALRNSYLTSAHEGWIAAVRVVLMLRLFPALPADLQTDAQQDLRLVLANANLSRSLVQAYLSDPALRDAAAQPFQALSAPLMEEWVGRVRWELAQGR